LQAGGAGNAELVRQARMRKVQFPKAALDMGQHVDQFESGTGPIKKMLKRIDIASLKIAARLKELGESAVSPQK